MSDLLITLQRLIEDNGGRLAYASALEKEWNKKQVIESKARPFEKTQILELWMQGLSAKTISKVVNRSEMLIYRVVAEFRRADSMHRKGNNR